MNGNQIRVYPRIQYIETLTCGLPVERSSLYVNLGNQTQKRIIPRNGNNPFLCVLVILLLVELV